MTSEHLLVGMLELAVPMWVEKVARYTPEHRAERQRICSETIGSKGDVILYKSKKAGESADAFNHLAEGLALLAFAPGGVKVFGRRWQVENNVLGIWRDPET